ncbi:hypothetical protein PG985_014402 [Apiospora marii]|uniref:Uncharacterized protein n=1 Tax=Apiospora marii TaxID=335849 RepID=A0ABR1R5T3_9PEZI
MQLLPQAQLMDYLCTVSRQLASKDCSSSDERIIGDILQKGSRSYQVTSCAWDTGDLWVLSVIVLDVHPEYANLRNRPLEAQAFWKHQELPPKLYESRKRRIRRLKNSRNFVDDLENEKLRVVVCCSPSEGIERHCRQEEPLQAFQDADFPGLGRNKTNPASSDLDTSRDCVPTYAGITQTCCFSADRASPEPSDPPRLSHYEIPKSTKYAKLVKRLTQKSLAVGRDSLPPEEYLLDHRAGPNFNLRGKADSALKYGSALNA